jgi:hypothetical protein
MRYSPPYRMWLGVLDDGCHWQGANDVQCIMRRLIAACRGRGRTEDAG